MDPRAAATLTTKSADETLELGRRAGQLAEAGDVLALSGPLGAGKTVFAKGVGEGLGVRSVVNSPTFILMNEHEGRLRLFHIDAYRLEDVDEAAAAGLLDQRQAEGVTVIEWAERIRDLLPAERLDVTLEIEAEGRRVVRLAPRGPRHERLAADLLPRSRRAA